MIEGELGAFIRSRREATRPMDVGLPAGTRRRTPGLRRAELATLAGVSVDYLIRLEQGRDQHPSAQVLAALADALRLSGTDRSHLHQLAVVDHAVWLCPREGTIAARAVRPTVEAVLDTMEPTPAYVVNHIGELLAWTGGYDRLSRPLGVLDRTPPNLVWFTLADERAKRVFPDWEAMADEQVALLHALRGGDPAVAPFVGELSAAAGTAFTDRWERRPLPGALAPVHLIEHPEVGALRLATESLDVAGGVVQQRIVVHIAADEASAAGLDRLVGRAPGALRSLSS